MIKVLHIILGKRKGKELTAEQLEKYNAGKHYYDIHGDVKLPVGYGDNGGRDLYAWSSNQKIYARTGKFDDNRKRLSNEIGAV